MEVSFCELRSKEVVNIYDGRSLGHIIDIVIDTHCARVAGIVVAGDRNFFNIFKSNSDFFIPYNRICRIGKDIILVELNYCKAPFQHAGVLDQNKNKKASTNEYIHNVYENDVIYEGNLHNYNDNRENSFRKNN